MYYQVTFTTYKCHEEESCVYISYFSVFYFCACEIALEVINVGQNQHNHSILQPRIVLHTKFQFLWCIIKNFIMGIFNFWHIYKNVGRVINPLGALNIPVRQLRNRFSNSE